MEGTNPSGTKITAATKMTPVPRTQYWSHTSARAADAKLMSRVPTTGPMTTPRPPMSVQKHHVGGEGESEDSRRHESGPVHVQGTGDAGQRPADAEHPDLDGDGVVAERLHPALVVADADQDGADGSGQEKPDARDDHHRSDRDREVLPGLRQRPAEGAEPRHVGESVESASHFAPLLSDLFKGERQHEGQQSDNHQREPAPERGHGDDRRDGRAHGP